MALKEEYAKAAIKRLQDTAAFHRGRASPYCGIGDALLARAQVESIEDALVTLSEALSEGFEEALKVERGCVEAVVSSACPLLCCRLLLLGGGMLPKRNTLSDQV